MVQAAETLGAVKGGESVKITVATLRKELGINSNEVAANRLKEAVENAALKEDDSKAGSVGAARASLNNSKPPTICKRRRRLACSREAERRRKNASTGERGPKMADNADGRDKTSGIMRALVRLILLVR